ncbi:MAG TPA: YciI family protein [Microlunatus sp.]
MKYLVLLAGDESVESQMSEAEVRAEMADHDAFSQAASERGTILAGEALGDSATATTLRHVAGKADGQIVLTDGPYAESVEHLGGFYLIEMADLDAMTELCALLPSWYSVEIRPVVDPPAT